MQNHCNFHTGILVLPSAVLFVFILFFYMPPAFADYSFGAPTKITNNGGVLDDILTEPYFAASGNNVYAVWNDARDVYFDASSDNGTTFTGSPTQFTNTGNAAGQRIMASGSNVYVVWIDNNKIFFSKSTDNGVTFNGGTPGSPGPAKDLGSMAPSFNPQLTASGNNVYITWIDNSDIFFVTSTNAGSTFSSPVNLSSTAHASGQQIATYGSNVYVVWQDSSPGNNDIFFSKSSDGGDTFNGGTAGSPGAPANISNNSGSSVTEQIVANGNNVGITWRDNTSGKNDILFKSSTDNGATFGGLVNLSTGLDVAGSTDSTEETLVVSGSRMEVVFLDDNTNPGFAYDVFFTSGLPTGASITFDSSQYTIGSTATITISSSSSNTNAGVAETVSPVTIKSTSDSTGITRAFTETGANTGIFSGTVTFVAGSSNGSMIHVSDGDTITVTFGGQSGTANIFARSISFDLAAYFVNSTAIITVTDNNANSSPSSADTVSALVTSTSNSTGVTIQLQETGVDTGIFTPTSNLHFNVHVGDTLTASYMGKTATATILSGPGSGGGGGGLIRPGLVLDAVLSILHVGGGPSVPPSIDLASSVSLNLLPDSVQKIIRNHDPLKPLQPFDIENSFDYPLVIDDKGYPISGLTNTLATATGTVGVPVHLTLNIPSSLSIVHIGLYTNLHKVSSDPDSSDTYVVYDKASPLQIVDPHKYFQSVSADVEKNGIKNKAIFTITFASPMPKSDIYIRMWNEQRSTANSRVLDAWQILPGSNSSSLVAGKSWQNATIVNLQQNNVTVTSGSMAEQNFMQYVKEWGGYDKTAIGNSEFLEKMGMQGNHIPSWFAKNTRYLIDGETTKDEFLSALRYLYDHKLVK